MTPLLSSFKILLQTLKLFVLLMAKVDSNISYWIASLRNTGQKKKNMHFRAQADPNATQNKNSRLNRQLQWYILMIDLDTFKLHNKINYWFLIDVFLIYANV